jgi:hypothetical protein
VIVTLGLHVQLQTVDIGICAGRPDDPSCDALHKRVALEIDTIRSHMNFGTKDIYHRCMDNSSRAVGDSFGGGQKVSWWILIIDCG